MNSSSDKYYHVKTSKYEQFIYYSEEEFVGEYSGKTHTRNFDIGATINTMGGFVFASYNPSMDFMREGQLISKEEWERAMISNILKYEKEISDDFPKFIRNITDMLK